MRLQQLTVVDIYLKSDDIPKRLRDFLHDFNMCTPCRESKPGEVNLNRAKLSMEEAQIQSQVIKADSSLETTLSRLAHVRVQVELIQEDTNRLKQGFSEMVKRINVLTASYHEERNTLLKRRTKA